MVEGTPVTGAALQSTRRVILLGASNVTQGLATVIATACQAWGAPLDILAAIGHGRSYGATSSVLGRSLPGILQCGLWEELQNRPPLPTAALVTDIGNDLLYGRDVHVILRWLETCLERLQPVVDRLVVTRLPLASITQTPDWKIRLLISLIFPSSRVDPQQTIVKAHELDHQLISFAGRYGAYVVQPQRAWYAWDPIHIARAHRCAAWQKYLSCWSDGKKFSPAPPSPRRWLIAARARPLQWNFLGRAHHCTQPAATFSDGTTLSLY
ncbi:MAG: hypothetical protein ACYC3X_17540 [Pirellulaceae bacterium]